MFVRQISYLKPSAEEATLQAGLKIERDFWWTI